MVFLKFKKVRKPKYWVPFKTLNKILCSKQTPIHSLYLLWAVSTPLEFGSTLPRPWTSPRTSTHASPQNPTMRRWRTLSASWTVMVCPWFVAVPLPMVRSLMLASSIRRKENFYGYRQHLWTMRDDGPRVFAWMITDTGSQVDSEAFYLCPFIYICWYVLLKVVLAPARTCSSPPRSMTAQLEAFPIQLICLSHSSTTV